MKDGTNLIETDGDVERAWAATLLHEHVEGPLDRTKSDFQREKYGRNANIVMTNARMELKVHIAEEADRIFGKRSEAEVQTHIQKSLFDTLDLRNNAAPNGIKPASTWLLEAFVFKSVNRASADDAMSHFFKRCSRWNSVMDPVFKFIALETSFIWLVDGFLKQHVTSAIGESGSMEIYAEIEKVHKTVVPPRPSRLSSAETKGSENTQICVCFRNRRSRSQKTIARRSWLPKILISSTSQCCRSRKPKHRDYPMQGRNGERDLSSAELSYASSRWSRSRKATVQDPSPEIVRPVNKCKEHAFNYRACCLVNQSSDFDGNAAMNIARCAERV